MVQPRVLVTAAAGKTGRPAVEQLLARGFPVRALVHRDDARARRLAAGGAEIMVGSLDDIADVRRALAGVRRAYFCPPLAPGALRRAAVFAAAAEEMRLEVVVGLSQWVCDPRHPAVHASEKWFGGRVLERMREVGVVTVSPGFFADNYMAVLESVVHFGVLAMPLGAGRNAPPSNEDIARVIVAVLVDPDRHVGRTYRPTGPELLGPEEIAERFGRALGRRVVYRDAPPRLFLKAARALGYGDYVISQLHWFLQDYRRDAFGRGAPTAVVEEVGGAAPEPFESIVRGYLSRSPYARRSPGSTLRSVGHLLKALVTRAPRLEAVARALALPRLTGATLAVDSAEWLAAHR